MKKAINVFLLIAMIFGFVTPCFAEFQPKSKRWTWITSDSTRSLWYDNHTVHPQKINGNNEVDLWILCYRNTPKEVVIKTNWTIDITNRKILVNNGFVYDMNWKLISQTDDDDQDKTWHPVFPETSSEKIYEIAKYYFYKKYSKKV